MKTQLENCQDAHTTLETDIDRLTNTLSLLSLPPEEEMTVFRLLEALGDGSYALEVYLNSKKD